MPFQLSPGVNVVEKDFTSIVPAVSSSVGGFAGAFRWGPIEEPTRVSSENELVKIFGAPKPEDTVIAQSFFTAANFLSYTNNMLVVRANSATAKNAVATASGGIATGVNSGGALTITNQGSFENVEYTVNFTPTPSQGGTTVVFKVNYNVVGNERRFTNVTDENGQPISAVTIVTPGVGYTPAASARYDIRLNSAPTGVKVNISVNDSGVPVVEGISIIDTVVLPETKPLVVAFDSPTIVGGIAPTATVKSFVSGSVRTVTEVNVLTSGSGYTAGPTFDILQSGSSSYTAGAGVVNGISATNTAVQIKNGTDYESNFINGLNAVGQFAAKYAGTNGNGLRVVVVDSSTWNSLSTTYKGFFTSSPGTSTFAESKGISDDEIHILVLDSQEGTFSGTPTFGAARPVILEKYEFVSKLSDARKTDGSSNYYVNVVNSSSQYIWWMDHPYTNQISNPLSGTQEVISQIENTMSFDAAGKKIIITASGGDVTTLEQLQSFIGGNITGTGSVTATSKDGVNGRQIRVENTTLNNGIYTISSINKNGNTFELLLASTAVVQQETSVANARVVFIQKHSWGTSSSTIINSPNARKLALLSTSSTTGLQFTLTGGTIGDNPTEGNIQTAFAIFADSESYDISLLATGNVSSTTAASIVNNVAEVRKDCMVFISPNNGGNPITNPSTAVDLIKAYRDATNINSSYAVMDSGWKYQYDRYNDIYRWIPLNGDIAGLCARTDFTADPWFSPGGFNRGVVKNIVKLGFNPKQGDRDALYVAGINPVVSFPGQGVVLFGDKTMLSKPSAFDRINVRRLFIVLEKSIAIAARFQLFEFNDDFTRAQFRSIVEPFLRDVQGRRGVVDFRVKCDETNNTGDVIDRNEFVADIFIKPNRSINFITLNFVAARSAVNFEEIGA